jgi:ribosomal protein L19
MKLSYNCVHLFSLFIYTFSNKSQEVFHISRFSSGSVQRAYHIRKLRILFSGRRFNGWVWEVEVDSYERYEGYVIRDGKRWISNMILDLFVLKECVLSP